ncbi:class I SAM-dependent methyltransferase [Neptunomonas sp. XY-337]|uniref:O-methyltransferase n=1 Tax=Neptunomonas sp. XY-337 TaxID=2561897 RepID=UPI0010AA9F2D|nr:class I SAM-dependent methyltransferase [Neptunomonas sp. XY-337]
MEFLVNEAVDDYAFLNTGEEPALLQELIDGTNENMGWPQKLSGRLVGRTLKMLAAIHQPKRALEIGMFTGYSALSIAEGMPEDGKLICCETNPRAIDYAKTFFDRSEHGHKIEVIFGRALDTLETLPEQLDGPLDFTFIDADKRNYLNYYEQVKALTRPGGLIILDNVLWSGKVLQPESEIDDTLVETNRMIAADPDVENVFLTVRDGINVVRKLR